jgi:acyl-CoA thioester hydrolase
MVKKPALRMVERRDYPVCKGDCCAMARTAAWSRDDFGLFRRLQTRWSDNDLYGHMNNVVHYSLFDTAVNGWLIEQGLIDIHNGPLIGLVVETGCNYFTELKFPDKVVAGIRIAHIGTSSVRYEIALFRGDEERAAAQGHFVHVYVDRLERKPTPLPAIFRGKLEDFIK